MKISGKSLLQTVSGHGLRLLLSLVLLSSVMLPFATAVQASPSPQYPYQYPYQYQNIPTFSIVSVNPNSTVTVQAANFPAGQHFTVRMGLFGTLGINGIVVATTDSGGGGVFQATYTIPDGLKGQPMIAIRMDNDTKY